MGRRLAIAAALTLGALGAAPSLAAATAGISKNELAVLRGLAQGEIKSLKIKDPKITAVRTTITAYRKAYPGEVPPNMGVNRIYLVQINGTFRTLGHTFKAFELVVKPKDNQAVVRVYSTTIENLSQLGRVYKL